MTAALVLLGVFLGLALLAVAALLVRQVGLTRRANEGLGEWKRRYERSRRDGAVLLSRYRELERRHQGKTPGFGEAAERPVAGSSGQHEPTTTRPARAAAARTTAVAASGPLTLVLPIRLLSKNARDKLHFRARHKLRQEYEAIIQFTHPRRGDPPQVKQRATVTRVLGLRERPFDGQNVGAGSAVELIDALTAAGYWVDDAPRWLETAFRQGDHPAVKGPAVVVEIEPLA